MSKPINYPNRIQDKHAFDAMRQIIDGHNALKVAHDANAQATQKNTDAIAALPSSYLTTGDVNATIATQLGTTGSIYQKIVEILKSVNITVPAPSKAEVPPGPAHKAGEGLESS